MIFFYGNFVNVKINYMFVEYNDVSLIGGNCKKSPMNIMLIPPNGKMLDFNFCNFKCIVASKVQPSMDISSIMMNLIFGHMLMIKLGLLIVVCLLINNPNKKCIIVPFINNVAFGMYLATISLCCFHVFKIYIG
jgi:hypothetical protein